MRRFAKLPTDFSKLLPNIRLAFGVTDVEPDSGVEYARVSGGSLTGTVTVPTASVGASGLELVNKEWVERAIDVLLVAPEISPEFTGLVLGVSPTSLRSTGEAATKEYVDGFSKQWSGGLPALSPDFQGTPQVEYSEDADITGSVVATMGVGYGSLADAGCIQLFDGTLPDAVSIPEVDDISTAAGEVILPYRQVIEAISADKFAPLDSPTFTGDVSVESSDLTYSGNEVVSSWWVTQRAQSDDSAAEVTDCFGAIPWFDLSLLSPRVITQKVKTSEDSELAVCDLRGQMIFDASLGASFYSEVSPGQSVRVAFPGGAAFYGTVNLFKVQDPGEFGPGLDQQAINVQLVFACSDLSIIDNFNSSTLFSTSVSTAATRSSKAIQVKTIGQNYLAWAPECDVADASDATTRVATVGFVNRAMGSLGTLSNYISGFSLYTTGMEDGLYVGPGALSFGVTGRSIFRSEASIYKTPGLFERGPGKGMIVLTDMQGMANDGQMRPEELIVAGWYNIYLIYDLETGVFDVCAALSECMTDPTFLLKETDARGISQKIAARFIGIAYLHPSDALGNKMHFARFIQQDGVFSFTPPDDSRRESQYPTFKVKGIELLPQSHRGRLDNSLLERSLMKNKDFAKAASKLNPDKSWLDWLGYQGLKVNNAIDGIWENLTEPLFSAEYDYNQKDFRADPVTIFTSGFFPSLAVGTAIVEGDYTLSIPVNRMNQRQEHFVPTSAQITSFNSYSHKDTWDKTDRFKCVAKPGVSAGFDESLSVITCSNRFYIPSTDTQAVTLYVDDIPFSAAYDPNEPPPDLVGSAIAGSNFYDLSISATLLMDIKRIRIDLSQFGPMISAALQTRVNQTEFALFDNNAPIVSLDDTESPGSLEAF